MEGGGGGARHSTVARRVHRLDRERPSRQHARGSKRARRAFETDAHAPYSLNRDVAAWRYCGPGAPRAGLASLRPIIAAPAPARFGPEPSGTIDLGAVRAGEEIVVKEGVGRLR